MDALIAPAQVWVPSAGMAALLLLRAFCGLWRDAPHTAAVRGYFIALGLAVVLPAIAGFAGWFAGGETAHWGMLTLLRVPADIGERHMLMTSLAMPAAIFLLVRFLFNSADALAYAAAAAAGFAVAHLFGPVTVIVIALAIGGVIGFADRQLGELPTAIAGTTAFALIFAYVYAGGGPAIPLTALAVVGGLVLSLIATAGNRARVPLYMILAALPAFALAATAPSGLLALSHSMPKPMNDTYGSLLLVLAVLPALTAPFVALSLWFTRRAARFIGSTNQVWLGPLAILAALMVGLTLSVALALLLASGGALFSRLHEVAGGGELFKISAVIADVRASPLNGSSWWLLSLLALPLLPVLVQLLRCVTQLFLSLLARLRVTSGLTDAIAHGKVGSRFAARLGLRLLQLVPSALILFALISAARPIERHFGGQIAQAGAAIIDACDRAAHSVEWSALRYGFALV